ncbi:homoserine kinase [uncultured Clostridium sp.]|uniref:homoserine kinase n=1 Tax=uncultured Clostridium sp. TaxID=59620 RepID=UPI002618F22F|nr:homoserine kinase [uncultured Clostridium sp.]
MIRLRVPATSANMGPGFDCMGVALNLYNEFEFEEIKSGLKFEGFEEEFCNKNNIVYKAMMEVFKRTHYPFNGLKIKLVKNNIPIARGLGSSSSCIVAGIYGANYISKKKLTEEELLDLAVDIEGHPDNVAPAILGGIVIAIRCEKKVIYEKIENKKKLEFISVIPDFKLETEEVRSILPKKLTYEDSVYNIGRATLLAIGLNNGNTDVLREACKDRLHEPYRNSLIKGIDLIKKEAYNSGALASYLSGAGPTINIIVKESFKVRNALIKVLKDEGLNYKVIGLSTDTKGVIVLEGGK